MTFLFNNKIRFDNIKKEFNEFYLNENKSIKSDFFNDKENNYNNIIIFSICLLLLVITIFINNIILSFLIIVLSFYIIIPKYCVSISILFLFIIYFNYFPLYYYLLIIIIPFQFFIIPENIKYIIEICLFIIMIIILTKFEYNSKLKQNIVDIKLDYFLNKFKT